MGYGLIDEKKMRKCYKIIDKEMQKAKEYKAKNGYRENLGYDSWYKLEDKFDKLDLNYQEKCRVQDYFETQCSLI